MCGSNKISYATRASNIQQKKIIVSMGENVGNFILVRQFLGILWLCAHPIAPLPSLPFPPFPSAVSQNILAMCPSYKNVLR